MVATARPSIPTIMGIYWHRDIVLTNYHAAYVDDRSIVATKKTTQRPLLS